MYLLSVSQVIEENLILNPMKNTLFFCFMALISIQLKGQQTAAPLSQKTTSSPESVLNKDYTAIDEYALSLKKKYTDLDELAFDLTKNYSDDADKVRAIYRWITGNIAYDCKDARRGCLTASKLHYAYKDPDDYRWQFARKVLRSKKGVCEGYSLLFYELCSSVGIVSCMAEGLADSDVKWIRFCRKYHCYYPDHAWNKVFVNGNWYYIDATWSSGNCNGRLTKYVRNFNENYYLRPISQLYNTHVENRY
jgi:transglutaminase/protease-like cytokinesis protein 3